MKNFLLLFSIIFFSLNLKSAVITATLSGNWGTASTWSTTVPNCGDVVVIPLGVTVTVAANANYSACTPTLTNNLQIHVYGSLKFTNGRRLILPCGSNVYVTSTGSLIPDVGGGSSTYLEICDDKAWTAAAGNFTGAACLPTPCVVSNNPLPVEFIAFTGELEQKVVFLNWKTITETNNDRFEIEKSNDGISYNRIGSVKSKAENGTNLGLLNYSFIDYDLKHPVYYYRLKQVDNNNAYKRTNSISVKIYAAEFSIFPNPNSGTFSIDVPSVILHEELNIKIYNAIGQIIHESVEFVKNHNITGSRVDVIPSQILPKGIYLSTISFKGEVHNLKIVVQ